MRSNKYLLGMTCLVAGSAMFAGTAHADRRSGLAGNLLIQDPDDLFPFPQYTLTHRNMLRLDYGGTGTSGNGVLTLGDENAAYGLAVHRGDLLSPDVTGFNQELAWLGGVASPFGGTGAFGQFSGPNTAAAPGVQPATVFDLVYGRAMGDNLLGARLGFGRGVDQVKTDGDVTKGAVTFLVAQLGYSMLPEDGLRLDLSGNIGVALGKSKAADDDVNSGYELRLGLLGRGYYPINEVVDVGFLANVALDNEHSKNDPGDASANAFNGGLMAGVGPAINLERAKVAAYAGLQVGFGMNEPNDDTDDDETSALNFAAPMVNMAAEVQLLDWMYVRTGAQYTWGLNRGSSKNAAGDDVVTKTAAGQFNWSAGLGVTKDSFALDGVIQNAFLTSGPTFIGGNANGFLAMASLTYKFGDVFSGAGVPAAEPAAVEPAPAPEPPTEPAPVEPTQEAAPPAVDTTGSVDATGTTTDTTIGGSAGAAGSIGVGR